VNRAIRSICCSGLLGVVGLLAGCPGCQTHPFAQGYDDLGYPDLPERSRSIALDSASLSQLTGSVGRSGPGAPGTGTPTPWYEARYDARLTTWAGYRQTTVDQITVITHDRQVITGDQPRDYYSQTTRRRAVSQIYR